MRLSIALIAVSVLLLGCASGGDSGPGTYTTIDLETAKSLHEQGAVFVDVRVANVFEDGHIPGAVNLTWGRNFSENTLAAVADKSQPVVLYCYGIACEISTRASERVVAWGYQEVYYFMRGYPAWWSAGYPIEP